MRVLSKSAMALLLALTVGVAAVAACAGGPEGDDEMACCEAMGQACEKHATAGDCCKNERDAHQTATAAAAVTSAKRPLGAVMIPSGVAASFLIVAAPAFSAASDGVIRDRHPVHAPPHLRRIVLLI